MFRYENITIGDVTIHLLQHKNTLESDFESYLLPNEMERLESINHIIKKEEFVATRILRTMVFGTIPIQYSEIGAPFINDGSYISISHSWSVVGIAHCDDFMIGLDLEPIRDTAKKVKSKFLSEDEWENTDTSSIEEMTKVWSGKEALYKLAGRKKIIFKESLLLKKIKDSKWEGRIKFPESDRRVDMQIFKKDKFIISINTSPTYDI